MRSIRSSLASVRRRLLGLQGLDPHLASIEARLGASDERWGAIQARLDALDQHVQAQRAELTSLSATVESIAYEVRKTDAQSSISPLMDWLARTTIEAKTVVSVVLPTWNRRPLLERAIGSVLAQSYANWELIVVDDGSADDTEAFLKTLDDERIRIRRTNHVGLSGARNVALDAASGTIATYLDDDNIMHPDWLKAVVWAFDEWPATDVLYGAQIVDDRSRQQWRGAGGPPYVVLQPFDRSIAANMTTADAGTIAHRLGLPEARFDEALPKLEDRDLFLRLTRHQEPLMLPVVACYYTTAAPDRLSGTPYDIEARYIQQKFRDQAGEPSTAPNASPSSKAVEVSTIDDPVPPYRADASQDNHRYRRWLACRPATLGENVAADRSLGPTFSVVVPVYGPAPWVLRACVESVRAQTWPHWELCLCDDGSNDPALGAALDMLARDPRIRVIRHERNLGIAAATNSAITEATGDYVAFLDHDDELLPGALAAMAEAIQSDREADVLYSDEDRLDEEGRPFGPRFKPDFSPDYLLTTPYMGHLLVVRRSLVEELGGLRSEIDGSQDFDLMLRATERARSVVHVPEVLYHWRIVPGSVAGDSSSKGWAYAATERAVVSALERRGEDAKTTPGPTPGMWHVRRAVPAQTTVTAIIDAGDSVSELPACTQALLAAADDRPLRVEIVVVAGDTAEGELAAAIGELEGHPQVRVVASDQSGPAEARTAGRWNRLSQGAALAQGELLLFLDGRVEPRSPEWLMALAEHAWRPGVGAVGARLLYPDGHIRHVGLVLGLKGIAGPVLENLPGGDWGYMESAKVCRNWTAVSGACLMTRREVFSSVGGFNPALHTAYGDVDYCLRVRQAGLLVVVTPLAELVHNGSRNEPNLDHHPADATVMLKDWGDLIRRGDPYFSPNLSRLHVEGVLPEEGDEARWNDLLSTIGGPSPG